MTSPAYDDSWLLAARSVPLVDVLSHLGITVGRRGSLSVCPGCGAAGTNSTAGNGPRAFVGKGGVERWHCFRCDASGDALSAVAASVGGFAAVRDWYADRGWCEARKGYVARPVQTMRRAPVVTLAETDRPRVPDAELRAVMRNLGPPDAGWLDRRMASASLARGLVGSLSGPVPFGWAGTKRATWWESGHRAIVPLWDVGGTLAGMRARAVAPVDGRGLKALPPRGYSSRGLVMANPRGRAWLRGNAYDGVVVVEGEPAWVLWSVTHPDVPVLGIISGSWTEELAAKVGGATVLVVTDHDEAGDRYAAKIAASVAKAIRWPHEKDEPPDVDRLWRGK